MTEDTTVAAFIDCNCFLQVRDLKDLPWKELFPTATRIEVMVVPAVIEELDVKKVDPKDRVRNRSRAAIKLIEEASHQQSMRLLLKDEIPTVALNIADVGRTDWSAHPKLDPLRPDDVFIAQSVDAAGHDARFIVSHDSGPVIRARMCGVEAFRIPDAWLLPDPVSDERKQLQALKRENEELKARQPKILAGWGSPELAIDALVVERALPPELNQAEIAQLVHQSKSLFPMTQGKIYIADMFPGIHSGPSYTQDDYFRYVEDYNSWVSKLFEFFLQLDKRVSWASQTANCSFFLRNDGSATAENATVSFSVSDGWKLFADEADARKITPAPVAPPPAPQTPDQIIASRVSRASDEIARQMGAFRQPNDAVRAPEAFHWLDKPGLGNPKGVLQCSEFRAKRHFAGTLWLSPAPANPPDTSKLSLDVHGSNLAAPVQREVRLRFAERQVAWSDSWIAALLPEWLAALVAKL